ncbi:heavy metal-associated isoprenylated plant protein 3-like [Benincasa hispida]|uniref:heavy metal-associated isoprenylated plant protein 3-like n=1 Tax=Benincasa hispida TaxID=102211 RepID=UPI001902C171|nr:heavy metal-associated isoprenylated plant protein 3-like [Benincasa hispida]
MNVGEKKADDVAVTAVFKIHMHCNDCAKKIKRVVNHFDKMTKESHVVLKMQLYFKGCIQKIKKVLIKFKGEEIHLSFKKSKPIEINFTEVSEISQKNLITAKRAMERNDRVAYLNDEFKTSVEVVPPKKEALGAAGGGKKEKEAGGGGSGDKKENDSKVATSSGGYSDGPKMEYSDFSYQPSTFYYEAQIHFHAPHTFNNENPNTCPVM